MLMLNQKGAVNSLLVSLILACLLLVGAIGFGGWAFSSRQDYKNNVDQKIAAAVQVEHDKVSSEKDKEFIEKSKSPVTTYHGPESYGSLQLSYPKTWSGYVDENGNSGATVSGFFDPGVVPSVNAQSSVFALRFQVVSQSYSSIVTNLTSLQRAGKIQVAAYNLPKVPSVVGVKVTGTSPFNQNKTATLVILPLRDKTLELWTEGSQFINDFNTYVLPNATFSP